MRQLLRSSLGRSLGKLSALDRLSAAWPVAAGSAVAQRAVPFSFEDGVLLFDVADTAWLEQLCAMQPVLQHELARISEVELAGIHFRLAGRTSRKVAPGEQRRKP